MLEKENNKIFIRKRKMNLDNLKLEIKKMLIRAEREMLNEKSKSKSQQRFMGMVYDCKKNPENCDKYSDNIKDVADSMKNKDVKDFAKTKHKGIPEKIEECSCQNKKHKIVIEKSDVLNDDKKINLLKQFVLDCCKELGINEPAKLHFTTKRGGPIQTTASFNTENNDIYVYTQGRHFIDILRSSGHELKHWHQNLKGELTDDSGKDGSPHENEAHAFAGLMLRRFSKANPEVYE